MTLYRRPANNIFVHEKSLEESDMPSFYACFDAFVMPTRGEGWGLPIHEGMAMGELFLDFKTYSETLRLASSAYVDGWKLVEISDYVFWWM